MVIWKMSSKHGGKLFFQVWKGGAVAILAVIEPEGDTGDGRGRDTTLFGNFEIRDLFIQQFGDQPAEAHILEFFDSHEVTEKIRKLGRGFECPNRFEKIFHVVGRVGDCHMFIVARVDLWRDRGRAGTHNNGRGEWAVVIIEGGIDHSVADR